MRESSRLTDPKTGVPRWARIALYSLLGILAVLAICVSVILNLDFGRFQGNLEDVLTEVLDREFSIDGDLSVEVDLDRIRIAASEVRSRSTSTLKSPSTSTALRMPQS